MSDWQPTCELRITYRWTEIGLFKTKIFVHQQKWVRRKRGIRSLLRPVVEEEWRNIPHVPEVEA